MVSFGACLTVVETSLQGCDDRITALEAKCEVLEKCNKLLAGKTEDLELRSRRQNRCMFGIPENLEGPRVTSFMTNFLLGMDIPDGLEMPAREHRLATRPGSGPYTQV